MRRRELWQRLESSSLRGQTMGFSIEHTYMLPSRTNLQGRGGVTREHLMWAIGVIRDWRADRLPLEPEPPLPRGRNRHSFKMEKP